MLVYKKVGFFLLTASLISGCATYQSKIMASRNLLKAGQTSAALENLKPLAETPSDDQLVYLMDYATALQISGQYKESNEYFLKADQLSEQLDYHSISRITLAALGSQEMVQYKGENFEKLFINVMLAINFLMLDQPDEALVEAKRINEKVNRLRLEGRKDFERNAFAHYLSALIWESQKKYDDAYIEYEECYRIDSSIPNLAADLIRSSRLAKRMTAHQQWKTVFPNQKEDPKWYDHSYSDLIIIAQQGWGPEKHFSPHDIRFPVLAPSPSSTQYVSVKPNDSTEVTFSQKTYDVQQVAIQTLDADYQWIALQRLGAHIAKDAVAQKIREENKNLGLIAWFIMHASDRADLRQWSTLPESIQLIRLKLKPGEYQIHLQGYDQFHTKTADQNHLPVLLRPKSIQFINWRTIY